MEIKIKEFIEQHLKKIYENCPVYFDIQENDIIVKNEITKEQKDEWDKAEPELRKIRIRLQEAKIQGVTDLPEPPPQHWEDVCQDKHYQLEEDNFQQLITELNEWETSQNKRVENISSLIDFLEWVALERDKAKKEMEKTREKEKKEMLSSFMKLALEQKQKKLDECLKKLHPDFNLEFRNQWLKNGFGYYDCKEWIDVGLKPHDSWYASWLRDVFELTPSDYLNINDDKSFREKYKNCLLKFFSGENKDKKEFASKLLILSSINDEHNSEKVRNILLIGRTGNGKSTLANVLVNKNGEFEEVFKESARSVSETKSIQTERFTVDISKDGKEKIDYLVIDTAGFGDTQLDNKEILSLLKDLVPIIKKVGLNQIFFVTGGRFTQSEIDTYKLLESVLFDEGVNKYTTIVRTNFEDFENSEACEEDERSLREENQEIFKILQASKIIYVDNPRMVGRSATTNKEIRKESRKRLLTYLATCQDSYYPADLENLSKRINDYVTREEELKKELVEKEKNIQEQELRLKKEIETVQTQKDRELKIIDRNFDRQIQELRIKNQRKLQTTKQEFEEVNQWQLKELEDAYNEETKEIREKIQNNLNRIRNSYNQVRVGEPICSRGHDWDIKVYDKSGYLIPEYQSDFIGYIYCPICGSNDYNPPLRNAEIYTLEEWSQKNSQQAELRREIMQEAIDEQNRKEQEIINRINQERVNREIEINNTIQKKKKLEQEMINKQKEIQEELIRQRKQISEGKISSISQGKIDKLKKELTEKKQELEDYIKKSEEKRNMAQQELYAYIEQRRK